MNRLLSAFTACALAVVLFQHASPAFAQSASVSRSTTAAININTADVATLAREIKGIGEAKARAIVEHRQKNGAFRSVDELALVKGIGAKTLENNRSRLTVGSGGGATKTAPTPRDAAVQKPPKPVSGGR